MTDRKTCLGLDYGEKNIGLAISVRGVVSPLKTVGNDKNLSSELLSVCREYAVEKVYVGLPSGKMARKILAFVSGLKKMLKLPIETVDETLTTRQSADLLPIRSPRDIKIWKAKKDSLSAAHILKRVII